MFQRGVFEVQLFLSLLSTVILYFLLSTKSNLQEPACPNCIHPSCSELLICLMVTLQLYYQAHQSFLVSFDVAHQVHQLQKIGLIVLKLQPQFLTRSFKSQVQLFHVLPVILKVSISFLLCR